MKFHYYLLLVFLFCNLLVSSQNIDVELQLVDSGNDLPIENVHVFIANTTFGVVSDSKGKIHLTLPSNLTEDMIISHLSYDLIVLSADIFTKIKKGETLKLNPNSQELAEIEISAKISRKRKKQIKRFLKAFFGDNKQGDQCKVLNKEVLKFEEKDNELIVRAADILNIENPFLGYKINYLLNYLKIADNGSIEFLGRSHFTDWKVTEEILLNRESTYLKSSKHFFKTFIDNSFEDYGFVLEEVVYEEGIFHKIKDLSRDTIFNAAKNGQRFTIAFDHFFQVINRNESDVTYATVGVRSGGLESQKFGSSSRSEQATVEFQSSMIYKTSPYIILDSYGNVLNSKDIREYGFWAKYKMAHQLPLDYVYDYQEGGIAMQEEIKGNNEILEKVLSSQDKLVLFITLLQNEEREIKQQTLELISEYWEPGFNAAILEVLRFSNENWLSEKILKLLNKKNDTQNIRDFYSGLKWLWSQEKNESDYHFSLKKEIYKYIDPKFEIYFKDRLSQSRIRLDEVVWGGVEQDGIPPLRDPKMIGADEAHYLEDDNVVFGMYINGIARAYPKRILAWHEFFVDDFENDRIAGVYCTLCGTVIAYNMTHNKEYHDLGTSGFLFRSNKLMYDKKTQSLWSTIEGKPVIGPLVDKDIELETFPVVTTTWKEWRQQHPETEVLSIETGHRRDYNEGAAYHEYFATDELMFPVPSKDNSLDNKAEVFVIRAEGYKSVPLAISVDYLKKKKWHQDEIGSLSFVAIADEGGAVRAYHSKGQQFTSLKKGKLIDENGRKWTFSEECLISDDGRKFDRIAGHNIFWFAWHNAYPDGRLVK